MEQSILQHLRPRARAILADLRDGTLTAPAIAAKHGVSRPLVYHWYNQFTSMGMELPELPATTPQWSSAQRQRHATLMRRRAKAYWRAVRAGKRRQPRVGLDPYGARPGEAKVVLLILQLRRRRQTTTQIAAELNRRRIRPRRAARWGTSNIQKILNRYAGKLARRLP